ncbi:uncharacterized protein LOC116604944 [Nematostella vectensis]|uniref:uncharacterized protein LOC116604944 n=1 Tax=Nematostella vectensis TaxID=45351 RepID=UPI002077501B|nr:uncharacterized protein LOC116604944 [Nematostella vectensis]XP_048587256.1 uncharacterized protein LOC116604944 [Nematostella vectensis]
MIILIPSLNLVNERLSPLFPDKMSHNRRNGGPRPTGCTKASKIRELMSALDYANRAIRSLNNELRKLGAKNDTLEYDLQDGNRLLTEEQRNAELFLKKQDKGKMLAKLQELKLQKVFIQHLLKAMLEKVLSASAPALAVREEKNLQSFSDGLQEEKEKFAAQIAEQAKNNAAKDALLAVLKGEIKQAKIRSHACTAESQTCSPSTTSVESGCTTECAEADVQATSEVTVVSVETQTDVVPERRPNRAIRAWQSFREHLRDLRNRLLHGSDTS